MPPLQTRNRNNQTEERIMAYSQEQWNRAEALFGLGFSLGDIEEDTGISKGQLSKKSKAKGWKKETEKTSLKSDIVEFDKKKETLDNEKETITKRLSKLSEFEITVLQEKMDEEGASLAKSLVFNNAMLALVRSNEELTRGKKTVLLKVAQYDKEGGRSESFEPYEIALSGADIKDHVDLTDRASLTLKVNERHAKSGDVNVNATAGAMAVSPIKIYIPSNGRDSGD